VHTSKHGAVVTGTPLHHADKYNKPTQLELSQRSIAPQTINTSDPEK
jgi:hypothetical protein